LSLANVNENVHISVYKFQKMSQTPLPGVWISIKLILSIFEQTNCKLVSYHPVLSKKLMGVRFFCNFDANVLKSSNAYCSIQLSRSFPDSLTPINFPTTRFCDKSFAKPAEGGS
jgi:hypothetical protein